MPARLHSKPLNERYRLWLLKKGYAESEVGGDEYRSTEEFLAKMKLSCCRER